MLAFGHDHQAGPTAVVTRGANPGLASTFVKQALLHVAADNSLTLKSPQRREEWARLACTLGIDALLSLHEMAGKDWRPQSGKRIIRDEIISGIDELGVLLMGNAKGIYWYGSRLSIEQARQLATYNNATSMQVTAGVLAGMVWALRNPRAGVVDPDDLDHRFVLDIAPPYLGEMVGVYGD